MKHIVLFSGGHSSARVGVAVVRRFGPADTVFVNHDIHPGVEDPDIKRFKREVAAYCGVPITYANHPLWDRMDPLDVVLFAGAFKGANGHVLCTNRLKSAPFQEWLEANADPADSCLYYGFDASETDRIQRRIGILGAAGWRTDYPLARSAEWGEFTIGSTEEIGIRPPLTYGRFKHANCVGCLKAGRQHWYVVFCERPDIWRRAKAAEDEIGYTILRDTSLAELEPLFTQMQRAEVEPTERVHHSAFWSAAKKAVRALPVLAAMCSPDAVDERPCECVV